MIPEGPPLERLTRRLSDCPAEFLLPPRLGGSGTIDVPALVADLFRAMGAAPVPLAAARPGAPATEANRLSLIAVAVWLLHDEWFLARPAPAQTGALLGGALDGMAAHVQAEKAVTDPDHREELARRCLAGLGLLPAGESVAQATDRLTTLDSVERDRVERATAAVEARAQAIRTMMAKRLAEEAAAKVSRE
jgi:hypothetical protein